MDLSLSKKKKKKENTSTGAGLSVWTLEGETETMKRRSVLVLLVVAFVGCNLLLAVSYRTRSTVKDSGSDPSHGTVELYGRRMRIKETRHDVTDRKARGLQNVRADDYTPVDPSPSSKARITPGPIEHGTHLFPFLPRYTPPPVQSPDSPGED